MGDWQTGDPDLMLLGNTSRPCAERGFLQEQDYGEKGVSLITRNCIKNVRPRLRMACGSCHCSKRQLIEVGDQGEFVSLPFTTFLLSPATEMLGRVRVSVVGY